MTNNPVICLLERDTLWKTALTVSKTTDDPFLIAGNFIKIFDFVNCVLKNESAHIEITINRRLKREFKYHKCLTLYLNTLPLIIKSIDRLPIEYTYTEHINLFRDCWKLINFQDDVSSLWSFKDAFFKLGPISTRAMLYADLFNNLVNHIRVQAKISKFSTIQAERRRQANERFQSCSNYVDKLYEAYAHLVVIGLNLYYKKEFADHVDYRQAKMDLDRFLKNRNHNVLFEGWVGYIIKMEYGMDRKFHFHTLLFFNGAKRQPHRHIHLTQQIGEYWSVNITKNRGAYWNSNADIDKFIKKNICGVGPIHHSDEVSRKNLKNKVILYLCKSDQYARPIVSIKAKLLVKGKTPPPARPRRPRKGRQDQVVAQTGPFNLSAVN